MKGKKLSTCFQNKDKNKFDHQNGLLYHTSTLVSYSMKIMCVKVAGVSLTG